jgi:hypothetical protein
MSRLGVMNFLATSSILFICESLSSKSSALMTLSLGSIVDSRIYEKFSCDTLRVKYSKQIGRMFCMF